MLSKTLTLENFLDNKESFLQSVNENWDNIPFLNCVNPDTVQDGTLVRFQGMIQDMHTPEIYLGTYEIEDFTTHVRAVRNGKYRDVVNLKGNEKLLLDSPKNVHLERQTLFVISVPGLNSWAEIRQNKNEEHMELDGVSSKRKLEEETGTNELERDGDEQNANRTKKLYQGPAENQETGLSYSAEFLLNFPIPDSIGKACLIRMYDDYDGVKINDMMDIVGFLAVNPINSSPMSASNDEDAMNPEFLIMNPPSSLIPSVHTIVTRPILHNNPLLPNDLSSISIPNAKAVREDLHFYLSQILLGDKLAADYLICHLLSNVYSRRDLTAVGKCSINISNIPCTRYPKYSKCLYDVVQQIVPKSHYLPMTLENMNSLAFTPKKDYECNRLNSGILQLSSNTHLVLDETQLQPGRLDSIGVTNVRAISHVIRNQKAEYDFKYYQMEYDTDIPTLVLSEGMSFLPTDVHVPISPDLACLDDLNEIMENVHKCFNNQQLENIRKYLTVMRYVQVDLSDPLQEIIQQDFCKMRINDPSVSPDDLHRLLVITKLLSASYGEQVATVNFWNQACSLEVERKKRIASLAQKKEGT